MSPAVDTIGFTQINSSSAILEKLRGAGYVSYAGDGSQYSACLSALLVAYKLPIAVSDLCDLFPYKSKQLNYIDLLNAMAHLGYIGRAIKLGAKDLDDRLIPCLYIQVDDKGKEHVSVILSSKGVDNSVSVFSGETESSKIINVSELFGGEAIFFTKQSDMDDSLSEESRYTSGLTWTRRLLERFKGVFLQVFIASVFLNIVALSAPLFVMLVYDRVISSHSLDSLLPLVVGAGIALVCEWVLRRIRSASIAWFASRLDSIVSSQIFDQLLSIPLIYTERASVSAQISRLKAFETIREFLTGNLFLTFIEFPFTIIILCAIAFLGGTLVVVPMIAASIYLLLFITMKPRIKSVTKKNARAASLKQQMIFETFDKIQAIRLSGVSDKWSSKFRELSGRSSVTGFNAAFMSSVVETITYAVFIISGMAMVVMAVDKVIEGSLTTGAMLACTILVWRVLAPFQLLCNSLSRYEQLGNALDQVNRLMSIESEKDQINKTQKLESIQGRVSFSRVGLRYTKNSDPVFAGLSFDIAPGELIAVTGGNGSGKSTILQLINGFYTPQAGSIRIDGMDIRQLDSISLRKKISYVSQAPSFFEGSILENLKLADPLAGEDTIKAALVRVGLWDEVLSLPMGLDTDLGINGGSLPSSLLYRLNLARAFLRPSNLILLDELPYALLNSRFGVAFMKMLENWKGKRTIIMVSHREDHLKIADRAVWLRMGEQPVVGPVDKIVAAIHHRELNR